MQQAPSKKNESPGPIDDLVAGIVRAFTPRPKRPPWLWADEKRILPSDSPEPGAFKSSRAPWTKGISEAHTSPLHNFIVAIMGSQMSKTETLFNICGHNFDDNPQPFLWITPNRKLAESMAKNRLRKMLLGVPSLWAGLAKGKSETITEKFINGARLGFGWAGSATELASHPAYTAVMDERDRMSSNVGGEGDPTTMVRARVSNYIGGTVTSVSTPTTGGLELETIKGLIFWAKAKGDDVHSPIWRDFQGGSRHHWAWRCPDEKCAEYFIPRMDLLQIADGASALSAFKNARIACPNCGGEIHEIHKRKMNDTGLFLCPGQKVERLDDQAGGVWISQDDAAPSGYAQDENGFYFLAFHSFIPVDGMSTASFWVSGLCSPWVTFGARAQSLVEAKIEGNPEKEQAVINTGFGELYNVTGDAPPWRLVLEKRGAYTENEIPQGVQFLTAGVDVQGDGFYGVIRGWGYNRESWLIEAFRIHGPTDQDAVWQTLYEHLADGRGGFSIRRVFIDSGYKPGGKNEPSHRVYDFCSKYGPWAVPIKGRQTMDKFYRFSDITDKRTGPPLKLCLLNVDHFKSFVHARIQWEAGTPGDWHTHTEITDDYCKQVTAEARLVRKSGQAFWMKLRKDNHFLDCEAYATGAAELEGVSKLQPLPNQTHTTTQTEPATPVASPPKKIGRKKPKRGARGKGHSV